jgi:hypothetical protein
MSDSLSTKSCRCERFLGADCPDCNPDPVAEAVAEIVEALRDNPFDTLTPEVDRVADFIERKWGERA